MKLLAVDPSVNNVGLAWYDTDCDVLRTRLLHPPKMDNMAKQGAYIVRYIYMDFLQGKKIDKLVIEYPNWQNSEKGLIAMQQGYTLDLAYICGVIAAGLNLASANIYLPTPLEWKGNLPKQATMKRVQDRFGFLKISEHEYDAVGLLQWLRKQPGIL